MTAARPNFERPPVVEQAITIMFAPVEGFTIGDVGLFWASLRGEFPVCQAVPRLQPTVESFGGDLNFQISLSNEVEVPRAFFRNHDGNELIQLQSNRFAYNWMRAEGSEYPRHQHTIGRFWEFFGKLEDFLRERGLEEPKLQQCEIVNVNIVPIKDFGGSYESAFEIFSILQNVPIWADRIEFEAVTLQTHYLIKGEDGLPIGRLHFDMNPVRNAATGEDALRFDLTARGPASPLDRHAAERFFGEARDCINTAFMRLTTDAARRAWGEKA